MNILSILSINIFSLFILTSIFINENLKKLKKFYPDKIFNILLITTMFIIILDSSEWIMNGQTFRYSTAIYYIITAVNFIVNPFISIEWTIYVDYQLYHNKNNTRKKGIICLILTALNALPAILSPAFGMTFYIDGNNIYHRGNFYICTSIICYLLLVYTEAAVIRNKKRMHKNQFISLAIFPLPMFFCSLFQNAFYGTSFIWAGCTLSIIIIYISIQNKRLNTDYLTGLYNRRQLDIYLNEKIKNCSKNSLFVAIMIDIDDFKTINDGFGHNTGDKALEYVADILEKCFTKNDLICRYAGDEFVVVLDIKKETDIKRKVESLQKTVIYNNLNSGRPYRIGLSVGYDMYDYGSKMNSEQFIKQIDDRMYEEKKLKKR